MRIGIIIWGIVVVVRLLDGTGIADNGQERGSLSLAQQLDNTEDPENAVALMRLIARGNELDAVEALIAKLDDNRSVVSPFRSLPRPMRSDEMRVCDCAAQALSNVLNIRRAVEASEFMTTEWRERQVTFWKKWWAANKHTESTEWGKAAIERAVTSLLVARDPAELSRLAVEARCLLGTDFGLGMSNLRLPLFEEADEAFFQLATDWWLTHKDRSVADLRALGAALEVIVKMARDYRSFVANSGFRDRINTGIAYPLAPRVEALDSGSIDRLIKHAILDQTGKTSSSVQEMEKRLGTAFGLAIFQGDDMFAEEYAASRLILEDWWQIHRELSRPEIAKSVSAYSVLFELARRQRDVIYAAELCAKKHKVTGELEALIERSVILDQDDSLVPRFRAVEIGEYRMAMETIPRLWVRNALPLDLAFTVRWVLPERQKCYQGEGMVVLRGSSEKRTLQVPLNMLEDIAELGEHKLAIQLTLDPSGREAAKNPRVKGYWPHPIALDPFTIRLNVLRVRARADGKTAGTSGESAAEEGRPQYSQLKSKETALSNGGDEVSMVPSTVTRSRWSVEQASKARIRKHDGLPGIVILLAGSLVAAFCTFCGIRWIRTARDRRKKA